MISNSNSVYVNPDLSFQAAITQASQGQYKNAFKLIKEVYQLNKEQKASIKEILLLVHKEPTESKNLKERIKVICETAKPKAVFSNNRDITPLVVLDFSDNSDISTLSEPLISDNSLYPSPHHHYLDDNFLEYLSKINRSSTKTALPSKRIQDFVQLKGLSDQCRIRKCSDLEYINSVEQLAEINRVYYQNENIKNYRKENPLTSLMRAESIIDCIPFDIEKKMEKRNSLVVKKMEMPIELQKLRKFIIPFMNQYLKSVMQCFEAEKINILPSKPFLSQAKKFIQSLQRFIEKKPKLYLCSEVGETFCSFFCGKVIDAFSRQDLNSITKLQVSEMISNIKKFVFECYKLKLDSYEYNLQETFLKAIIQNHNFETIRQCSKKLALAGIDLTSFIMHRYYNLDYTFEMEYFNELPIDKMRPEKFINLAMPFTSPIKIGDKVFYLELEEVKRVIKSFILTIHSRQSIIEVSEKFAQIKPDPDGMSQEEINQMVNFYNELLC